MISKVANLVLIIYGLTAFGVQNGDKYTAAPNIEYLKKIVLLKENSEDFRMFCKLYGLQKKFESINYRYQANSVSIEHRKEYTAKGIEVIMEMRTRADARIGNPSTLCMDSGDYKIEFIDLFVSQEWDKPRNHVWGGDLPNELLPIKPGDLYKRDMIVEEDSAIEYYSIKQDEKKYGEKKVRWLSYHNVWGYNEGFPYSFKFVDGKLTRVRIHKH